MPDFSFLDGGSPGDTIRIDTTRRSRIAKHAKPAGKPTLLNTVVALLLMGGCVYVGMKMSPPYIERHVSREQMGDDWPLRVAEGKVRAYTTDMRITFVFNGNEYAVNGIARGHRYALRSVDEIARDGRNAAGLLEVGLALQRVARQGD